MSHLRLGIDLDGVVADFNRGWISRYNRDFGTGLSDDAVVEWDAPKDLTHFDDMNAFWEWAKTCGEGKSLFRWLDPYPGAVDALDRLARQRHRIVILTTKPSFAVHDTYAWLADNRIPTTEVHIVGHKPAVDCDMYLDDADHNLLALVAEQPNATVCRLLRPWNNPIEGAVDVSSLDDFADLVTRVSAAR